MALRRGPGIYLFGLLCIAGAGAGLASHYGYLGRLQARLFPRPTPPVRLSSGDFPAGVSAPVGDYASVPLRPTMIGYTARGSAASLLAATGGLEGEDASVERRGLFKTSYALDTRAVPFAREEDLRKALALGADNGGVDLGLLSVDRLAAWAVALRDAQLRTVLLVGRSRGQEAIAGVGVETAADLKGKKVAAHLESASFFFALWVLSQSRLSIADVTWVEVDSEREAGRALREGRADAAAGFLGDVGLAARDRGGKVVATTVDAPHVIATVLVTRGEFAARYPDAIRRVIRGLLDAGATITKDVNPSARLLGEVAPYLGDPTEAIRSAPPATLKENLAFFGLAGEAPVTYDELYASAAALYVKLGKTGAPPPAEDTRDLGALKYVSEARGP